MPIRLNAAKAVADFVTVNAAKTQADAVRVNAAKAVSYLKSDPQTATFEMNDWTKAFYNGGATPIPTSGQGASFVYGDLALRYGRKFNGDTLENTMMALSAAEKSALEAFVTTRPNISLIEILLNTQHTQNSQNFPAIWVGWHGETTPPGTFQRLHTEKQANWGDSIAVPHNTTNDGDLIVRALDGSLNANISAQIVAGNIGGMTISWEDAANGDDWGWLSGSEYNTDESAGTAIGTWISTVGHAKAPQLRITADF